MNELMAIVALLILNAWLLFLIVGSCIVATVMVWQMLKSIWEGDFP